jgi:simple sugar transport system ATP-binding protein
VYPVVDRIVLVDRGKIEYNYLKSEVSIEELIGSMYTVAGHEVPLDTEIGAGG